MQSGRLSITFLAQCNQIRWTNEFLPRMCTGRNHTENVFSGENAKKVGGHGLIDRGDEAETLGLGHASANG